MGCCCTIFVLLCICALFAFSFSFSFLNSQLKLPSVNYMARIFIFFAVVVAVVSSKLLLLYFLFLSLCHFSITLHTNSDLKKVICVVWSYNDWSIVLVLYNFALSRLLVRNPILHKVSLIISAFFLLCLFSHGRWFNSTRVQVIFLFTLSFPIKSTSIILSYVYIWTLLCLSSEGCYV